MYVGMRVSVLGKSKRSQNGNELANILTYWIIRRKALINQVIISNIFIETKTVLLAIYVFC